MARRLPPKRHSRFQPLEAFIELEGDEKQALIHAHAERRVAQPRPSMVGMYVSVALCTVFIIVGWVIALPRIFDATSSKPDAAIQALREGGAALGSSFAEEAKNE